MHQMRPAGEIHPGRLKEALLDKKAFMKDYIIKDHKLGLPTIQFKDV